MPKNCVQKVDYTNNSPAWSRIRAGKAVTAGSLKLLLPDPLEINALCIKVLISVL